METSASPVHRLTARRSPLTLFSCAGLRVNSLMAALLLSLLGAWIGPALDVRAGEWESLFDGTSLKGWRLYGRPAPPGPGWKAEDQILKKLKGQRGGNIITEKKFTDFELEFEWRLATNANSGVKYLVTEDRPSAPGHEYQIIDDSRHPDAQVARNRITASFYDVLPPSQDKPPTPPGQWHASKILVKGNHIEHWINGKKVLEYELGSDGVKQGIARSKFRSHSNFGSKLTGHIMLTDHQDECWYRNIRIRELAP